MQIDASCTLISYISLHLHTPSRWPRRRNMIRMRCDAICVLTHYARIGRNRAHVRPICIECQQQQQRRQRTTKQHLERVISHCAI